MFMKHIKLWHGQIGVNEPMMAWVSSSLSKITKMAKS